jgi:hypothetical protein
MPRTGQRDQRAEQRDPADERFRPVNRIEDPDEFGILAHSPELLAEDAVFGKMPFDQRPHRPFRLAVSGRDWS